MKMMSNNLSSKHYAHRVLKTAGLFALELTTVKPVLTLSQTSPGFYVSAFKVFENTVGKGETARNEQFLLFSQCFLPILRTFCHINQV